MPRTPACHVAHGYSWMRRRDCSSTLAVMAPGYLGGEDACHGPGSGCPGPGKLTGTIKY